MTQIFYNGKRAASLEIHDNGDYVWLRCNFEDGSHSDTLNLKGEL